MSKVNIKKDRFFQRKLDSGYYTVNRKGHITNRRGKRLGTVNSRGYVTIGCKNKAGKLLIFQAHRLVWMALKGPIPEGFVPNHKDGDKQHNAIRNLELVTHSRNNKHAHETGLHVARRGQQKANAVFTDKQVIKYRRQVKAGKLTVREIAAAHGCHRVTVSYMLSGKTYK